MSDLERITAEALALDQSQRTFLIASLIESLDQTPREDVEQAWVEEAQRRIAAKDAGEMTSVPWEEVRQRMLDGPEQPAS